MCPVLKNLVVSLWSEVFESLFPPLTFYLVRKLTKSPPPLVPLESCSLSTACQQPVQCKIFIQYVVVQTDLGEQDDLVLYFKTKMQQV